MNIGVVTIAYNSYGRFIRQWCDAISQSTVKPDQVTVLLGMAHGATVEDIKYCRELLPGIVIKKFDQARPMGFLRNIAISNTMTEWILYLSIDDILLPEAIRHYNFVVNKTGADFICAQWITRGLGMSEDLHKSPHPAEMAERYGKGFIVGHSPYRRIVWEKTRYEDTDYPNQPFVGAAVANGFVFAKATRPGTVYLRRPDSHSRTILQGPNRIVYEKMKANSAKRRMEQLIRSHYLNLDYSNKVN